MTARASIQRLARELAAVDPANVVCPECSGSGRSDYGVCQSCDGYGSWARDEPVIFATSQIQAARNARPAHPLSAANQRRAVSRRY
jgi:DnaJ-class molecular chaperone